MSAGRVLIGDATASWREGPKQEAVVVVGGAYRAIVEIAQTSQAAGFHSIESKLAIRRTVWSTTSFLFG